MRSIAGHSSSLIQTNPLRSCVCAIWKMRLSAWSSSSSMSPWCAYVSWMVTVDASISRRSTAFSRTMLAWYSMLAAVGTASSTDAMNCSPPTASRSPAPRSSSASVTGSMTSPRSKMRRIARKARRFPSR